MKAIIAAAGAASFLAAPAMAGPYVDLRTNVGTLEGEYTGSTTQLLVGVEGELNENLTGYAAIGPAYVDIDGVDDGETEVAGELGLVYAASEQVDVYGEITFISDQQFDNDTFVGFEAGVKYSF